MIRTKLAAGALVSALILSLSSSIAFAAPLEKLESINFKQTYIVSNNSSEDMIPDLEPFTYSIGNDVDTSFSTITGINDVYKGDLEKVTLNTTSVDLDKTIKAGEQNVKVSYDINISFGDFSDVGIHRYTLNRNDGQFVYFDVFVFNEGGTPIVGGCNFYSSKEFSDEHQTKIGEFIDSNDNFNIKSIIRFEDENGEPLLEDIVLSKPYTAPTKPETPITLGGRGNAKISTFILHEIFTDLELGLGQYEQNLQTLLNEKYALIKDEVAENKALEAPAWFSENPEDVLIFHVVMRAPVIFKVRVSKVDYDDNSYLLKGAEFTIFREDGTIVNDVDGNPCVGVTNKNGYLEFKVYAEDGVTFYIQETKAPNGYSLNETKFPITPSETAVAGEDNVTDIPILVEDKVIIIHPRTGDTFNPGYYICVTVLAFAVMTGGIIYVRKKIKQNSKNPNS